MFGVAQPGVKLLLRRFCRHKVGQRGKRDEGINWPVGGDAEDAEEIEEIRRPPPLICTNVRDLIGRINNKPKSRTATQL